MTLGLIICEGPALRMARADKTGGLTEQLDTLLQIHDTANDSLVCSSNEKSEDTKRALTNAEAKATRRESQNDPQNGNIRMTSASLTVRREVQGVGWFHDSMT